MITRPFENANAICIKDESIHTTDKPYTSQQMGED